jgi:hypothetical protein
MRKDAWLVIIILIKLSVSLIGMVEIREVLAQNIPERREVRYMYWGDIGTRQIQRANPDGSNIETVVTGAQAWDLALDIAGGKIYWVSLFGNRVRRANLDGSNVEDLVTGRGGEGIDLDLAAGKMYWAGGGQIQRANLDGSQIEPLITGLSKPDSMVLDLIKGQVYWTDSSDGTIQRANLDGSNIELLVTGLSSPQGLNLDLVEGKMYWSNWPPADKIQRANLDGSNIEDIAPGFGGLEGVALDFNTGKIYWTDFRINKIQRANFDGSNIEDIVTTGLDRPICIIFETVPISLTFTPSTVPDQTFTVGTEVSLTLPTATGGTAPYTYSLSPIPAGLHFDTTTQLLSGTPTTVTPATSVTYTATDAIGASASSSFTIEVVEDAPGGEPLDVNRDGQITVIDLAIVALFYGTQVPVGVNLPADVNADGIVNILDLTAVAQGIDAAGNAGTLATVDVDAVLEAVTEQIDAIEEIAEAPARFSTSQHARFSRITYRNVAAALADTKHLATDARLRKWVPLLEELLQLLTEIQEIPDTTALLPNYPNPFNPETWIPYHLAQAADVAVTIYDVRGSVVQELRLGHQPAGVYESQGRAAYWDGRNQIGEKVASGLYFYSLTTSDFTATRKMLIAK